MTLKKEGGVKIRNGIGPKSDLHLERWEIWAAANQSSAVQQQKDIKNKQRKQQLKEKHKKKDL